MKISLTQIGLLPLLALNSSVMFAHANAVKPIETCDDLQNIQNDVSAYYELSNDIYCGLVTSIGSKDAPFTGTLDGKGNTIHNLFLNDNGLFVATSNATITQLHLKDVRVISSSSDNIAAITSNDVNSTINKVSVGGIIEATADVSPSPSSAHTGGLIGIGKGSKIIESYADIDIDLVSYNSFTKTGGLIGYIHDGQISNSYAIGKLSVINNNLLMISMGGLIGVSEDSTITNSFADVAASFEGISIIGGLIALRTGGEVISSYWNKDTIGLPSSEGGTPKSTEEMHRKATYVDWDFDTIWGIDEEVSYPWLNN